MTQKESATFQIDQIRYLKRVVYTTRRHKIRNKIFRATIKIAEKNNELQPASGLDT